MSADPQRTARSTRRRPQNPKSPALRQGFLQVARWTGLEPATPGVTGRYSNQLSYHRAFARSGRRERLARWTGLEPATPGVTGRYSIQLSYHRASSFRVAPAWGGYYGRPSAASSEKAAGKVGKINDPVPGYIRRHPPAVTESAHAPNRRPAMPLSRPRSALSWRRQSSTRCAAALPSWPRPRP